MIFLRHLEIFNFLNGLIPRIKRNKFIFFSQSFTKRSTSLPEEHTSSCSGTVCSFASKFQINFMVKLKLAAFYGADHRSNSTCLKGKIPNSWRLSPKESAPLLSHDVSTWLLALCTLTFVTSKICSISRAILVSMRGISDSSAVSFLPPETWKTSTSTFL